MDDRTRSTLAGIECLADDVLAALGEHLHRNILGNHIVINQRAKKFILSFACRRKSDLDLLESDIKQYLVIFKLFSKTHRNDKALVTVSHIHRAPYRRFFNVIFFHPFVVFLIYREVPHSIFTWIHHIFYSF